MNRRNFLQYLLSLPAAVMLARTSSQNKPVEFYLERYNPEEIIVLNGITEEQYKNTKSEWEKQEFLGQKAYWARVLPNNDWSSIPIEMMIKNLQ
jgi:hypothetical protein